MTTYRSAIVASLLGLALGKPAEAAKPKTIRWFVAHERANAPFAELIDGFARGLEQRSAGSLKVDFVKSEVPEGELEEVAYRQVSNGDADLAQLPARAAGVDVFETPFLFRSYEHAELVFEGPVGRKLIADIATASGGKVRGFAFTYSGGYRILVGRVPLRRLEDFKGLRMRQESGLAEMTGTLGVKTVEKDPRFASDALSQLKGGGIDLAETEVNRMAVNRLRNPEVFKAIEYANLTRHRMYVTALVANERFLKRLSEAQRGLLSEELAKLAVAERRLSVRLERENLEQLAKEGLRWVEMPQAQHAAFVKLGQSLQASSASIDAVRAVRDGAGEQAVAPAKSADAPN